MVHSIVYKVLAGLSWTIAVFVITWGVLMYIEGTDDVAKLQGTISSLIIFTTVGFICRKKWRNAKALPSTT